MQETSFSLQPGAYFCRATLDFSAINYLGNSSQAGITQLLHTALRAVVIVKYGAKDNDGDYERNHHT